jgi:predicted DNA-binding transcriptional regulator AlpA
MSVSMSAPIAALSIADTARTSGIGRSTLYAMIAQGCGPRVTKINNRSVILIEERDRWLRSFSNQITAPRA